MGELHSPRFERSLFGIIVKAIKGKRQMSGSTKRINLGAGKFKALSVLSVLLFLLVLNQCMWDGSEIIPAAWIGEAAAYHTEFEPSGENACEVLGYGYLFWLRPQGDYDSFIAVGYGGQFVYVIPELDMVVVMTADLTNIPETFRDSRMLCQFNLVEDFILPAVI